MSDADLSDVDDIVRQHEFEDNVEVENDGMQDNYQEFNVSNEEVKNDDDEDAGKTQSVPVKKRTGRKLFVLNTERLKGCKGVHTIEKLYEGFQFQDKRHEAEDLDRVMKRLEYWAYRLFPKLEFDDFLAKCEHLGHKKDLQTYLKKYRLGMISADDDITQNVIEDDEIENDPDIMRTENELLNQINNDEFQRLFDETEQATEQIS